MMRHQSAIPTSLILQVLAATSSTTTNANAFISTFPLRGVPIVTSSPPATRHSAFGLRQHLINTKRTFSSNTSIVSSSRKNISNSSACSSKAMFRQMSSPSSLAASQSVEVSPSSSSSSSSTTQAVQTISEEQMTKDAEQITRAAISAVDPATAVRNHLSYDQSTCTLSITSASSSLSSSDGQKQQQHSYKLDQGTYDRILICAFGKAATSMALEAAAIVSGNSNGHQNDDGNENQNEDENKVPVSGIVITKHGHATEKQIHDLETLYNIQLEFASHPVPDESSVVSSGLLLDMVQQKVQGKECRGETGGKEEIEQVRDDKTRMERKKKTFIINCISGGGSALFCTPRQPLSLTEIASTNDALLSSGMPITEMNILRKKLESGKGGGLVGLSHPSTSVTLVLSDVIGDPLDLISSGPSVYDESSWEEAWDIVVRYGLEDVLPASVVDILRSGKDGKLLDHSDGNGGEVGGESDLPSKNHPMFTTECEHSTTGSKLSETALVGNNASAVNAAAREAKRLGYNTVVLGTTIEGEAMHIANMYVSMAQQVQLQRTDPVSCSFPLVELPAALIAGGETTVTLSDDHGKGGRNQEIGLAAALKMKACNLRDIVLSSVGTDGTDGPTDAAGSVVDGSTIDRVELENGSTMLGKDALERHDAYSFLDSAKTITPLVKTGPTGTNVADICVTLIR